MFKRSKTKIIATIGPASNTKTELREMIRAGVSIFRINGAYGKNEDHHLKITKIRSAAKKEGVEIAILLDLPGPKFRIGTLKASSIKLRTNSKITLAFGKKEQTDDRIPIPDKTICRSLKHGNTIFINDGIVELRVQKVTRLDVECKVKSGGEIRSHKGINLPRISLNLPSLTQTDKKLASLAIKEKIDYIGLSFVRSAKNIMELRKKLHSAKSNIHIIAKIEKPEALDDLDSIIDASDAVMVARGDLGIEMPFDQIPLIQKHILKKCMQKGKPAITATQMLESMVNSTRPTRAEATDVAEAVWQGTDAVMLSEETSIGINPAKAVSAMRSIAIQAEAEMPNIIEQEEPKNKNKAKALAVSKAACALAKDLNAKAILTPTRTGRTALLVSKLRPKSSIFAPTSSDWTARKTALYWGVFSITMPPASGVDELLRGAEKLARKSNLISRGDTIVTTSGAHDTKDETTRLVEVRLVAD